MRVQGLSVTGENLFREFRHIIDVSYEDISSNDFTNAWRDCAMAAMEGRFDECCVLGRDSSQIDPTATVKQ